MVDILKLRKIQKEASKEDVPVDAGTGENQEDQGKSTSESVSIQDFLAKRKKKKEKGDKYINPAAEKTTANVEDEKEDIPKETVKTEDDSKNEKAEKQKEALLAEIENDDGMEGSGKVEEKEIEPIGPTMSIQEVIAQKKAAKEKAEAEKLKKAEKQKEALLAEIEGDDGMEGSGKVEEKEIEPIGPTMSIQEVIAQKKAAKEAAAKKKQGADDQKAALLAEIAEDDGMEGAPAVDEIEIEPIGPAMSIQELLAKKKAEKEKAEQETVATDEHQGEGDEKGEQGKQEEQTKEPEKKSDGKGLSIKELLEEKKKSQAKGNATSEEKVEAKPEPVSESEPTAEVKEVPPVVADTANVPPTSSEDQPDDDSEKNDDDVNRLQILVTFILDNHNFGVEIESVQEVLKLTEITRVPNVSYHILGVINLRGHITPVIDLRKRFELNEAELSEHSRLVIMVIDGSSVGFVVDSVPVILQIPDDAISLAPNMVSSVNSEYIKGVVKTNIQEDDDEQQLVILLDLKNLLSSATLQQKEDK